MENESREHKSLIRARCSRAFDSMSDTMFHTFGQGLKPLNWIYKLFIIWECIMDEIIAQKSMIWVLDLYVLDRDCI